MNTSFRRLGLLALLTLLLGGSALAQNAAWPNKAVRFVNSWPAGGPSDILARAVGDVLQKQYGQPFVIDNRAGGSGQIGMPFVARAPADGVRRESVGRARSCGACARRGRRCAPACPRPSVR